MLRMVTLDDGVETVKLARNNFSKFIFKHFSHWEENFQFFE